MFAIKAKHRTDQVRSDLLAVCRDVKNIFDLLRIKYKTKE